MGLRDLGFRDMGPHLRSIADASARINPNNGLVIRLGWGASGGPRPVYHTATDKIITWGFRQGSTGSPVGSLAQFIVMEPDGTGTTTLNEAFGGATSSVAVHFFKGQVDDSNNQKLYSLATPASTFQTNTFQELDPVTGAVLTSAASLWPNMQYATHISIATPATPGFWDLTPGAATTEDDAGWIFFEGMTDGGFDNVGAGTYSKGFGLIRCDRATVASSGDADLAFIWVDLDSGNCVGNMTIPGRVSSSSGDFIEPQIAGATFDWGIHVDFVADSDSTYAQPKGELRIIGEPFTIGGGTQVRWFVRRVDFNPYGISTGLIREHGRIRQTSVADADISPLASGWPTLSISTVGKALMFRDRTNRYMALLGNVVQDTTAPDPSEIMVREFGLDAEIEEVSAPGSVTPVRTGDTTTFEAVAFGSIGERVGGASTTWSLQRASTRDEVLTITGGIGTTSTVTNGPISANQAQDPEGTLVVTATTAGVPTVLAETTDYTVVLSTGVITWVTDQSSADEVTASYDHRTNVIDDGVTEGTLLTSVGQTDDDGKVQTRVRYPDGADTTFIDVLEVTVEN